MQYLARTSTIRPREVVLYKLLEVTPVLVPWCTADVLTGFKYDPFIFPLRLMLKVVQKEKCHNDPQGSHVRGESCTPILCNVAKHRVIIPKISL